MWNTETLPQSNGRRFPIRQVAGIGDPMTPVERPIANVLPDRTSTWNPATSTHTLNYKVIYEDATYYTNEGSTLVLRKHIRGGVN